MSGLIKSTSHSRLMDFEECNYKAFLKIVEKRPDLSPKTAADRGTEIHDACEKFVDGRMKEMHPVAARFFTDEMESLRQHYANGAVSLEGEWGFDLDWKPCDYKKAWLKIKADAVVHMNPKFAAVIDYKTGKRFSNEMKHGQQLMLYSIGTMIRNPKIEKVKAELWYFDQNELAPLDMTKTRMESTKKMFDRRFRRMTDATEFPPNPNVNSCKWCPYRPVDKGGDGFCKHAHR